MMSFPPPSARACPDSSDSATIPAIATMSRDEVDDEELEEEGERPSSTWLGPESPSREKDSRGRPHR
jgi:hypothetical protein